MRKYIKNTAFLGFALFSIIATVSCEVGLGASVDTERPALNITYPPKGSIIMDTFTLAGTVSDDIGVSYINVTLTHKTLKTEYVYKSEDGSVTIEKPAGSWAKGTHWNVSIGKKNPDQSLYNGWDLPDGDYFIDVEASDGVGSVYDRRSIRIDNTAPVFISDNITSLGSTDVSKISTFGQKINLKGSAKDDSEISKVYFDFYNEKGKGSKSLDYDMTSDGILLAKYSSVVPSTEAEKILAENYRLIYGLDEGQKLPEKVKDEDKKTPYLVIRFADNARIYDAPVYESEDAEGASGFEGRGQGNLSTELFLNTQAFGLQYITIDELNEYQKRLSNNAEMERKLSDVSSTSIANTAGGEISDFGKINKIKIDPEINPKWNIDSFGQINDDFNKAYLDSTLTVMFACGNDNTEFLPENICILLERLEETGTKTGNFTKRIKSDAEIEDWANNWTDSSKDTKDLVMLKSFGVTQDGTLGKLVTAYAHDIKLDSQELEIHNRYRFVVLGKDNAGYEFTEQNISWYGFEATKQAEAPEIRFKKGSEWVEAKDVEGAWFGPDTENIELEFNVTIKGEELKENSPAIGYVITDSNGATVDDAEGKYIWEKVVNPVSPVNSVYEYKWVLKNAADGKLWMPSEEGNYKLVVTIEVQDKADGNATATYKLNIDRKNPGINVKEVSPYIEDGKINGTVTVPVSFTDANGVAKAEYSIQWDETHSESNEIALDSNNAGVITLDTTSVDNKSVVLNVKATDVFGNAKIETVNFTVDQNSDKPKIELNLDESGLYTNNSFGLTTGNTISVHVSDDDGINDASALKVKVWGVNDAGDETLVSDWKTIVLENGKAVWNFYTSGTILKDGKYKVQFAATDKVGTLPTSSNETGKFAILVDGTAPQLSAEETVKAGDKVLVKESGNYYVAKDKSVEIGFSIIEGNLNSVKVGGQELKGTSACTLKENSSTDWNVKYTWTPAANEESGVVKKIKFTAQDDSGNIKEKEIKLYYDSELPSIAEGDLLITPVLTGNVVNGKIYIEGKATDNDKVANVTGTVSYTAKNGSNKTDDLPFPVNSASFGKTESISIDTTEYEDNTDVTVNLTVTDRAGNVKTETKTYKIDQSTDKPTISFDTSKYDTTSTTHADVETASKNMFGLNTNNILTGTVTDDDGVGEITVALDGTTKKVTYTGKSVFNCNLKDDLGIDAAGNYILKINATDDVNKTKLEHANEAAEQTLYIVVDGVAPEIQNEKIGDTAYTSGIPVKGSFSLSFDVKEEHLDSVKVQINDVTKLFKSAENKDLPAKSDGISHFETTITPSAADKDSTLVVKITAVDKSGLEKEKELNINYDATKPEINTTITKLLSGNKVNGSITISGTIKDEAGSGVASGTTVKLYKGWDNENTEVDVLKEVSGKTNTDSSFTYTVDTTDKTKISDKSNYKLKVTALDKAGNPAEKEIKFTVDQSTDYPVITFANANVDVENDGISVFGSSGWVIDFAAEDDDGGVIVTADGVRVTSSSYTIPEGDLRNPGEHTVTFVVAEDSGAENPVSTPVVLKFAVDTQSPEFKTQTLNGVTYYDGIFVKGNYDIVFTVDDDNDVEKLEYKSGDNWIATGITASSDKKTFTHKYTGQTTKTVTTEYLLTDKYGFTATKTLNYKVDSKDPVLPAADNITVEGAVYNANKWFGKELVNINVSKVEDDNLSGTVKVTGDSSTEGESFVMKVENKEGTFSQTRTFADGVNEVTYHFADEAGNTKELSLTVKVDTKAPTVSKINTTEYLSASGVITGTETVKVNFKASDGEAEKVSGLASAVLGPRAGFDADSEKYDDAIILSSDGTVANKGINFNVKDDDGNYVYAEGKHEIWVRVTDIVGNASEEKLGVFILDRTAPKVEYTSHAAGAIVNKTITLSGTVKDENWPTGTVNAVLKSGGNQIGDAYAITGTDKTRSWTFTVDTTNYADGNKAFVVEVTDAAGNKSTDSITLNIDQDSDRPVIILDSINVTGTTSTLASGKIEGTVTDDDGIAAFAVKVMRKGKDADGNDEWQNVEGADSGWKTLTLDGGKFSYPEGKDAAGEDITLADGTYKVDFKVTDTASPTNFDTTSTTKPKVLTKGGSTEATSAVTFDVDGTQPTIVSVKVQVSSDGINYGDEANFVNGNHYGGPKKGYARLNIKASDNVLDEANLKVYVSVNGTKSDQLSSETNYNSSSGWWYVIEFYKETSGSIPVEIEVKDNTDVPATKLVSVSCDNTAPSTSNAVANMTPVPDDEVTGVVAISGTVNDDNEANSGINNVKYYVPLTTETAPAQDGDWSEFNSKWSDTGVTLTDIVLRIDLDGLSSDTNINSNYAGYETSSGSLVYQIPVWFRVEDNCGNVCYVTDKSIRYNPNAARPKIKRTYPSENAVTLGGTIRMAGTAEDDVDVDSIYVQYDVNADGEFTSADAIALSGARIPIYNAQTGTEITTVDATTLTGVTWGVKAEGSRSWNAEFDATISSLNLNGKHLKVRMKARDKDQNTLLSAWSDVLDITVNNNVPQFSQAYLVQYSAKTNGTEVKRVEYTPDIYVKGDNWFLEMDVTDFSDISEIKQDGKVLTLADYSQIKDSTDPTKNIGYSLKLAVKPTGGKFTTLIIATNNNNTNKAPNQEKYFVNIDNDAPAFEDGRGDNDLVLYAGDYGYTKLDASFLQNSNGYTVMSGKVNEAGSGFARAVFYLERFESKVESGDSITYKNRRLYNVMTGGRIDLTNASSGAPTFNADGLPVIAEKTAEKVDNYSFTVSYTDSWDENITAGSLLYIGNVYKTITDITDDENGTVTIEVSEKINSAWDENYQQKVQFVYAFAVDKSGETRDSSGKEKGGDGDGLVENYTKSGTNYTWEVSFDSSVIPDGPVTVHVVVFDQAGNSRHGTVKTRVANNAPRITSVKLGTDLNHSGSFEESEYTQFYAYKNNWGEAVTDQGKDVWNLVPSRETESLGKNWKVVSGLNVIPEFVGGNGNIHYIFSKAEGTGDGKRLETAETGETEEFATINETTKKLDVSEIELDDDAIDSNGEDGVNTFRFSFWDSTEESTPGIDSGSCVLNVELYQDLVDGNKPTASVSPFFWNKRKAGNNSVAWDTTDVNKPLGHIELEADWRSAAYDYSEENKAYTIKSNYSSLDDKLKDLDPKVSGKIVIRGTAYDETVLSKLVVTFDGIIYGSTTKCESEYTASSGEWGGDNTSGTGYSLTVTDSNGGVTQDGHSVNWELTLDTSKISGQTGLDKKVNVTAVDTNDATSTVADYKMDIVPYVTEVVTSLSSMKESNPSVYNRTATGHYPVQSVVSNVATRTLNNSDSESITLKGFNLNGTNVTVTNGGTVTKNVAGQISFTAAALKSTALDCKVNGIPLMNNLNNNNARGSYESDITNSNDYEELYAYAYNRVPNNDNNNRLTDDIIFDVWEFNDRVAKPFSTTLGGTVMKVNSKNNMIQYAFSNGTIFNMPTNEVSSRTQIMSYDTFQDISIGFTIDKDGRIYACGQSSDTNRSLSSDLFAMFSDKWGRGTLDRSGLMYGGKRLQIELTGQNNDDHLENRKKRIQSPSFAASSDGKVYLAYYDSINDEIRFRAGTANDDSTAFDMFQSNGNGAYSLKDSQLIAKNNNATMKEKSRGAGAYVSLAVTPMQGSGNSSKDTVISVWYDNDANRLRYSYIENPIGQINNLKNNPDAANWSPVNTIFNSVGGGKYCQVAVDAAGGVHVAAYVGSGQLYYAYAADYRSTFTEVCIDEVDLVGQNLTLDVALDKDGNAVPYIGYYSSKDKAKYAHPVTAANKIQNGSESGFYTGTWETTIVPSYSALYVKSADKVNVGVWKDTTTGKLKDSVRRTSSYTNNGTISDNSGVTYGNGTSNAVLVYQVVDSTGDKVNCIESAQLRGSE